LYQGVGRDGFGVQLLQIVTGASESHSRLAASIFLKNILKRHWLEVDNTTKFNDADKEVLRENILEALLREQDSRIKKMIAECIHYICIHDFPEKWASLVPAILATFASQDPQRISNVLMAVLVLVKRFTDQFLFT
jgi:exportin-2 (importin alpha re-exporter)